MIVAIVYLVALAVLVGGLIGGRGHFGGVVAVLSTIVLLGTGIGLAVAALA